MSECTRATRARRAMCRRGSSSPARTAPWTSRSPCASPPWTAGSSRLWAPSGACSSPHGQARRGWRVPLKRASEQRPPAAAVAHSPLPAQPDPATSRVSDGGWAQGLSLSLSLSFFLSVCARAFLGLEMAHSSDLHRQMHLGLTPVREGCENAFQKRVGNSPCGQELAPGVSPPTRRSPYNACCRCQCLGAVVGPARGGQTRTRICTPRKHRLWLLPTMFSTLQTQNQSITTNSYNNPSEPQRR